MFCHSVPLYIQHILFFLVLFSSCPILSIVHCHSILPYTNYFILLFLSSLTSCTTEEVPHCFEDLITLPDEVQNDIEQERHKKSAELLQKEHKSRVSDIYLLQLARAIVVLYSRQLLVSLLSAWPDDVAPVEAKLFGVSDGHQVSCIFDLLHGVLPKKVTDQVCNT